MKQRAHHTNPYGFLAIALCMTWLGVFHTPSVSATELLTDAQVENIVRHSYPYVAMYNVNNKFGLKQGWNTCTADTSLKDHTMTEIARPNNDTLYISCMLDLRAEPMIIQMPEFDSTYVSLMVTGYDHFVNVPLSVTKGDFDEPEKALFYTSRTTGFDGAPVNGIEHHFEMSGDFVSAVFRVMPHAKDAERFKRITEQMKSVKVVGLAELLGQPAKTRQDPQFPDVGRTDIDIYAQNFPQVMQFALNHTSFETDDPLDTALLSALKPMGLEPGKAYDPATIRGYDGARFGAMAERVKQQEFAKMLDPQQMAQFLPKMFRPKGNIDDETLLFQSVLGPIGLPASEAVYPAVLSETGEPMNALHDYVIDMDQLPPAKAFWSLTLYDSENGFFIPNDRKKYSVGENSGMKLNADGGITVYIAAEQPEGVPEENWLPIKRQDQELDVIMRIYDPDLEAFKQYPMPKAQRLTTQ